MTHFSRVEDLRVSIFIDPFCCEFKHMPFIITCVTKTKEFWSDWSLDLQDHRRFMVRKLVHHFPNVALPTESRSRISVNRASIPPAQPDEQKKMEFVEADNLPHGQEQLKETGPRVTHIPGRTQTTIFISPYSLLRFSLKLPLALFSIIFLFYFYNSNSNSPTSSRYSTSNTQRIRSKPVPL